MSHHESATCGHIVVFVKTLNEVLFLFVCQDGETIRGLNLRIEIAQARNDSRQSALIRNQSMGARCGSFLFIGHDVRLFSELILVQLFDFRNGSARDDAGN